MYRIKCSNGKYVKKTNYGTFISFTKVGKIWTSLHLANKNLQLCIDCTNDSRGDMFKGLTYELETLKIINE